MEKKYPLTHHFNVLAFFFWAIGQLSAYEIALQEAGKKLGNVVFLQVSSRIVSSTRCSWSKKGKGKYHVRESIAKFRSKAEKSLRSEFGDCLDSVVLLYYCATAFVIRLKEPKNYRLWHFKPFRNSGQNTLQIAILAEIIRLEWERHRPLPLKLQLQDINQVL